ncbi:MAG: histidine kinase [Muribaculaceae bacterium]|nr:histidine kinase [Muribaculaceae bacterium]
MSTNRYISTATVIILSIVVFYLPSILFQMEKGDGIWEWDFIGMVMATFYTMAFCLNYFLLVPRLLLRSSRLPLFFIINFCIVLATMIFIPLWMEFHGGLPSPPGKGREDVSLWRYIAGYAGFSIRDGIMMILAMALAYAIRFGKEKEYIHTRELELNAERRQIELQSLKAQLNPHFLFNSLNNIYALIGFAPDRAQESLHALSSMLRFMIYDSSESVTVEKEAQFIGEYVELMRLRMGDSCHLEYALSESLPSDARIAPLLYVTLVENAFKHSVANEHGYFIRISLYTSVGVNKNHRSVETLVFKVENTYSESEEEDVIENNHLGVGITNVRKQLNLLYPGCNSFEIDSGGGIYTATITIETNVLKNVKESK